MKKGLQDLTWYALIVYYCGGLLYKETVGEPEKYGIFKGRRHVVCKRKMRLWHPMAILVILLVGCGSSVVALIQHWKKFAHEAKEAGQGSTRSYYEPINK